MTTNPATSIRTEATQALLEQITRVLAQWRNLAFKDALHGVMLGQTCRDVDRARRQFDSKLFFVVVFGPLKAGKSTLTNALAGEYVSPAGFGKETTRRPSLVVQGNESAVEQYFSTEPEVNHFLSQHRWGGHAGETPQTDEEQQLVARVREGFDAVADYLRGIRSKEEFQGRIRVTTLPLNMANLEKALTEILATEPLLTVVRCKGGHLLSNGVAIVDMPGLDGGRSNWRADPIHEWVINRAEFFLFVQSSVAALNNDTQAFLKEVVANSTKPPVWLIQNIFDARHWLPPERRTRDEANQRDEGKRRFIEILQEAPRAVFGLNVGLGWDGKNEGREDWLTQSSFPEFETGLAEVLHAERALIQEKNSLENLRQRVESAREQLRDCQKRVIDLRDEYNQVHEKLGLAKSSLDAIDYRSGWEELVAAEIDKKIAVIASEEWSGQVDNETTRLQERYDGKHPGKIVNDELRELAARLGADGTGKCFAKKLVWPKYLKLTEQFCKAAENDALTKCNQLLTELNRPTLRPALDPSADDVPDFPDSAFKSGQLLEHHAWSLKWLSKNHDGSTIKVHIEKIAKGWKHQIELRRDAWAKGFIVEHFSTYCEKRRQHFRGHVERLLAGFELESRPKNQAANVSEKIIEQMKEGLGGLELPIANSSASMPSMR